MKRLTCIWEKSVKKQSAVVGRTTGIVPAYDAVDCVAADDK